MAQTMQDNGVGFDISMQAGAADMSANQYYIVVPDSTEGQVVLASGATVAPLGVIYDKPYVGLAKQVTVRIVGIAKVKTGVGGCTIGAALTSDGSGTAVVTTTAGDMLIGYALNAVSAGEYAIVRLTPGAQYRKT